MQRLQVFAGIAVLCGAVCALVTVASCGEDDATIRERVDAGGAPQEASVSDAPVASEGGTLPCGAEIPVNYISPNFTTNAAVELSLTDHFNQIVDKMEATEEAGTGTVTTTELKAIYNAGAPSLRSLSTTD